MSDVLREKIARAVEGSDYPLLKCDCDECSYGVADAVLAVLPEYEQVGWTVPDLDDIALIDGEGCGVGTYWTVPVYVKRNAEGTP